MRICVARYLCNENAVDHRATIRGHHIFDWELLISHCEGMDCGALKSVKILSLNFLILSLVFRPFFGICS